MAKEGRGADLEFAAELLNRKALVVVERQRQGSLLLIELGFSARPAGVDPRLRLFSQVATELRERPPRYLDHEFPHGGRRVDVLLDATKADPSTVEVLDQLDQMPKVSTDPIEAADDEGVP